MIKYFAPLLLFICVLLPSQAHATAFYIDFSLTTVGGNGLATTTAFANLQQFTDVARSAGDIAIIRRNTASTTNVTAASFTSDGTLNQPIVVSADYDDVFGDDATSTQTYSIAFASTTMTASANQSDIQVGDWLYADGDCNQRFANRAGAAPTNSFGVNPCEYAYEVSGVSSTSIAFYFPYRGAQSGSGINLRNMHKAPQIGVAATSVQIFSMSSDDYWYFKGLDIRGANALGNIDVGNTGGSSPRGATFYDLIVQGNGTTTFGFSHITDQIFLKKVRYFNMTTAFTSAINYSNVEDMYIDCNNVGGSVALNLTSNSGRGSVKNLIATRCANIFVGSSQFAFNLTLINAKHNNAWSTINGTAVSRFYFEDNFGIVGLNSQVSTQVSSSALSTTTQSTSTQLRAGGGPVNNLIFPPSGTGNTGLSTANYPLSYIKLFEYPIYSDTNAHTYNIYFSATSTSAFTSNPITASSQGSSTPELFIECEYYANATTADRLLKRSNTAGAFTPASDANWHALSVQCQPAQAGIVYLRGWYGKPKDGRSNWFLMDPQPIVTTP